MTNNPLTEAQVIESARVEIARNGGPRRVVVNKHGEAYSQTRAYRLLGERLPDVIFIRDDGWNLGATSELADVAEALWDDSWIAVIVRPSQIPMRYLDYKEYMGRMGK